MPPSESPLSIQVWVDSEAQSARAAEILAEEGAAEVHRFPGRVTGTAGAAAVHRLMEADLLVDVDDPAAPRPASAADVAAVEEIHEMARAMDRFLFDSGASVVHPALAAEEAGFGTPAFDERAQGGDDDGGAAPAGPADGDGRFAGWVHVEDLPAGEGEAEERADADFGVGDSGFGGGAEAAGLTGGTVGFFRVDRDEARLHGGAGAAADPGAEAAAVDWGGLFGGGGGDAGLAGAAPPAGAGGAGAPLAVPEPGDVYDVRIERSVDHEVRAALDALGLRLLAHTPPHLYRYYLRPDQVDAVRGLSFVSGVQRYGPEKTVGPEVLRILDEASFGAEGPEPEPHEFALTVHRPEDLAGVRAIVQAEPGAEVTDQGAAALRFRAPARAAFLSGLTQLAPVASLDLYTPARLYADVCRTVLGVDAVADFEGGLDGAGEVVALFDSGVDASHPDLARRLVDRRAWGRGSVDDLTGHGTHVAGIIAGDGTGSGGRVRGVATGASLFSVGIAYGPAAAPELDVPADLGALLKLAVEVGAFIVNLSWGAPKAGRYEQWALSIDRFAREHPGVLVVTAAGNEGTAPRGALELYRLASPASAKNVLAVGATLGQRPQFAGRTWGAWKEGFAGPEGALPMAGSPDELAALSSTGPTEHDSIKPEVVAPGTYILSTRARGATQAVVWEGFPDYVGDEGRELYCYCTGTSMAAPAVAGAAALVRQYLRRTGIDAPSAALLKAVLVASAQPIRSRRPPEKQAAIGYPDFDQGFGRVDLRSVLPHAEAPPGRKLLLADVPSGSPDALVSGPPPGGPDREYRVYVVNVPEGPTVPLRVALTWTDPPGPGVHNKLQLAVRGPGNVLGLGNAGHTFGRNPVLAELAPGRQALDRRNTVEVVRIEAPPPGRYYIRVQAYNTPTPRQGYALAVSGVVAENALA